MTSRTITPGSGKNWSRRGGTRGSRGSGRRPRYRASSRGSARSRGRSGSGHSWFDEPDRRRTSTARTAAGSTIRPTSIARASSAAWRYVRVENAPNAGAQRVGGARRRPGGTPRAAGSPRAIVDPRRLQRERAPQVALRDDLVADLGVRDRAAPQRGRALGRRPIARSNARAASCGLPRQSSAWPRPATRARAAETAEPPARTARAASSNCSCGTARSPRSRARLLRPGSCSRE